MADVLIMRLQGPMMSFGAPQIDGRNVTYDHPTKSLITGIIGNALGIERYESSRLAAIQDALGLAARADVEGLPMIDYQTVDLGQPHLSGDGWTTDGKVETRGGANGQNTHIRYRHYLADARYLVAVSLRPGPEVPSLEEVGAALAEPARPLFLGRKCCPPTAPIFHSIIEALSEIDALQKIPVRNGPPFVRAWWSNEDIGVTSKTLVIYEQRDWANRIHAERSLIRTGLLRVAQSAA